jgi:hypothetical protein
MTKKLESFVGEQQANKMESEWGPPMSETEMAAIFNEKASDPNEMPKLPNTPEEAEKWEQMQDNAEDIYKVKARIQNQVPNNLTPVGEMLVNSYAHVIKAFYDFAPKLKDEMLREEFKRLIRAQESMPGNFIGATMAQMNVKK